jgi:hypothetical protein
VPVDDGGSVERIDLAATDRADIGFADALDIVMHGGGIALRTVVERQALPELEDEGPIVRALPGFNQPRRKSAFGIHAKQGVVNGAARGAALNVAGQMRIECQRIGEDRDGKRSATIGSKYGSRSKRDMACCSGGRTYEGSSGKHRVPRHLSRVRMTTRPRTASRHDCP